MVSITANADGIQSSPVAIEVKEAGGQTILIRPASINKVISDAII